MKNITKFWNQKKPNLNWLNELWRAASNGMELASIMNSNSNVISCFALMPCRMWEKNGMWLHPSAHLLWPVIGWASHFAERDRTLIYLWFTLLRWLLFYNRLWFLYWPWYFYRSLLWKVDRICSQYKGWMGGMVREAKLRWEVFIPQLSHASRKFIDTRLEVH